MMQLLGVRAPRGLALALAFALALCSGPAAARSLKDYQRKVWSLQEGAPPDIHALAQTTDGWLWIGTGDGLFRFDGVSFEPYTPPGNPELAHLQVINLHAADNGDLYISYFPIGVAVLRREGRVELLPQPKAFRRASTTAMALDRDGALWMVGGGIHRFANGQWTTVESDPIWNTTGFYSLLLDQDGRLWVAEPSGAWQLDRARGRFARVSGRGGGLAQTPEGEVWLLGHGGGPALRLATSASGSPRPRRANAIESRYAGQFASDGTLWALGCPDTACLVQNAAQRGAELLPGREAGERLPSAGAAAGRESLGMLEDQEGNIWIVSHQGLSRFRPKRFVVPGLDLRDMFYSAASDKAGQIWVADTVGGKLLRLAADGTPLPQPGPPVHMLASGRDGALLMADKYSIRRVLDGAVETITLPPGPDGKPRERELLGILDDGKRLWSAAIDTGAIAWAGGKWISSAEVGLPNRVYLSQAGGPGQLWLAIASGELALHDNGKLTRYDAALVGTATGIFPGEPLVLGGTNGLAVLKNGKFELMHSADPDALRGVSGLAVTADGDRWLNGVAGVVHVRRADWQRALERPDLPLRYELFGVADGYPGRASTHSRRITAISGDGRRLWFIATNGIVGLDSADLRRNTVAPRPVVQEVITNKGGFAAGDEVRLPPGSDSFRVRFTAPALRQPEQTRFEYRLEGVDADWRDAGTSRSTSYTNIGPGSYVFRVRATNEDGLASKEDAVLRLSVAPTLVQSLPFRIALAVALAALLYTLYRLRLRYLTARLMERMRIKLSERERIARALHDTILQTVQALLLRLGALERTLPEEGRARQQLQAMLDDTQRVIDEGRHQVLGLRTTEAPTLEEVVRSCAEGLRELQPEIEFVLSSEGAERALVPDVAEEAGLIASEALRNAYTHAQARRIVASIQHGQGAFVITVHDDGRGLDQEVASAGYRKGHWGLVGMRERAGRIGARVDIDSAPGNGTVVTLSVPAARAYTARAA